MDYRIQVEMRHTLGVSDRLEDELILHYEATIIAPSEEGRDLVVAGRATLRVVRLGVAFDRNANALDACDALDQDACDFAAAVLDPETGQMREDLTDQFDWTGGDVMFLQHVEILPGHRGQQLGLVVVDRLIDVFVDGLVVCRPLAPDDDTATTRLQRYARQLGFVPLEKGGFFALSTAMKRPPVFLRAVTATANDNRE
jgi:hypothetical protein